LSSAETAVHDPLAERVAELAVQRPRGRAVDGDGGQDAGGGASHRGIIVVI
jgi:hypothetical protein